jgi:hypothetical protein
MRERSPRLLGAAGVAFVVVTFVGELLKGDSPSPRDSEAEIASWLANHRDGILAGAYIQMIGLFLLALVVLGVVERVWSAQRRPAALAAVGGVLLIGAYTTYVLLTAIAGYGAATDVEPATSKALWGARFVAETFIAFPAALLLGSVAVGALPRRALFPQWYAACTAAATIAFLVGGAALADDGFFAPDGGYGFILFWLLPLWIAVSGVLVGRRGTETPMRPAVTET